MPYQRPGDPQWRCNRCGTPLIHQHWCPECCRSDVRRTRTGLDAWDDTYIRPHSWTPPGGYAFKGEGPVFLGMELEYTDDSDESREIVHNRLGHNGELGWMVYDGSVEGFEVVTQPMSYAWALRNFPWDMLPDISAAGSYADEDENGLHVHVGLTGFDGDGHQLSWVKFFYRNADPIIRISRRESDRWASFDPGAKTTDTLRGIKIAAKWRARHRELIDSGVPDAEVGQDPELRRMKDLAARLSDSPARDRYNAVNLDTPHGTFEVRCFASTLVPRQAQAALGLVDSSVEYTRRLTVAGIRDGAWNWDRYVTWLRGRACAYAPLLNEIEERIR